VAKAVGIFTKLTAKDNLGTQPDILLFDYVSRHRQKWSEPGAKESRRDPEGSGDRNLAMFVYFYVMWMM
jgi:hypothetical protein